MIQYLKYIQNILFTNKTFFGANNSKHKHGPILNFGTLTNILGWASLTNEWVLEIKRGMGVKLTLIIIINTLANWKYEYGQLRVLAPKPQKSPS